jgi:hypothetical protein
VAGNLVGDQPGMIRKALKCDVADVEEGLGLVRFDGAWERSCVVGTQRREAKGAK